MRPYIALWRMRFRTLIQYRVAAVAGLLTQIAFGLVMVGVLTAFYRLSDARQPMTLAETVTYTWIGQAMLGMLPWGMDSEVSASVRSGQVAYDLARPISVYRHWYARALALRTAPTLLRAVPMFTIALFFLPESIAMEFPTRAGLAAWALSTFGALLLSCALTNFMQSTLFWTVTGLGVQRILPSFVTLLSGMAIPLPLFPDWMQPFLRAQPFSGLVDIPARLFCGALPPQAVWETLPAQLIWTGILILLGRLVLTMGMRRVSVAGG